MLSNITPPLWCVFVKTLHNDDEGNFWNSHRCPLDLVGIFASEKAATDYALSIGYDEVEKWDDESDDFVTEKVGPVIVALNFGEFDGPNFRSSLKDEGSF